jgi:amidase
MVRANTIRHRDWHRSNNERHRMRRVWAEFFREWDVLLCPVAASAAFPHDQAGERWERTIEVNGRRVPTTDQLFWAGLNGVVLLPGTVAPLGLGSRSGLPIGVQIVTAHCEDRTSLAFARLLEEQYRAFEPPPGYA